MCSVTTCASAVERADRSKSAVMAQAPLLATMAPHRDETTHWYSFVDVANECNMTNTGLSSCNSADAVAHRAPCQLSSCSARAGGKGEGGAYISQYRLGRRRKLS